MEERSVPRILLVEDDPDTALLIQETLHDHFAAGCVRHCSSMARALAVDLHEIDFVLSDMNLPDGTGLELLGKLLARRKDIPVVIVTGEGILDNALRAISDGAYDYVVKAGDYLFAIPIVVEKNLAIWKMMRENVRLHEQLARTLDEVRVKNDQLEEAVEKLEMMASTDPLTGIANRRAFNQAMERRFAEAMRHDQDLAMIMIDLDGFKVLNDRMGHQAGDVILQRAGRILEANCRRSDLAGRFGGDEFVVLLPETDLNTARVAAERIKDEFEHAAAAMLAHADPPVNVSMSMGIACLRHSQPVNPEQLVGHADEALYKAKATGKTRIIVYNAATKGDSQLVQNVA
ncbi:MAG: diguanylate cyclase [Phycisphaeraceae bacterium]